MIDITIIIGSIGLVLGLLVAPPQIYKILKYKSVIGISKSTYWILLGTMICYFVRALAIHEWIFILSNGINIFMTLWVVILIKKYEEI